MLKPRVLTWRPHRRALPSDRHAPELLRLTAASEGQTAPLLQVKHGEEAAQTKHASSGKNEAPQVTWTHLRHHRRWC